MDQQDSCLFTCVLRTIKVSSQCLRPFDGCINQVALNDDLIHRALLCCSLLAGLIKWFATVEREFIKNSPCDYSDCRIMRFVHALITQLMGDRLGSQPRVVGLVDRRR